MKPYVLHVEQFLKKPLKEVFEFFERPENLKRITPPYLNFKILTPSPIKMEKGAVIEYIVKPLGFPVHWKTRIKEYQPPHRFVDVQTKGPYKLWEHTHTFREADGGTWIEDSVRYILPFGVLGKIVHAVHIKNQLKGIFEYRRRVIEEIL